MAVNSPPAVPKSVFLEDRNGMKLYELTKTVILSYSPKIKIVSIGEENELDTKNIILLGETGAGKTCLLNALVNHLLGVKFEDDYRYILKDETGNEHKRKAFSQTEYVVGYLIYGSKRNCNYMIVDTPGLNDSQGQERELEIFRQIRTFLKDIDGVEELHCIGFVVNGTIARIQKQFKDIVEEFCNMFGDNAKHVIKTMVSFGNMKEPPVLDVLKCSCLEDTDTCIFDNVSLYECNQTNSKLSEDDITQYKITWRKTARIYDSFFREIDSISAVSLGLTREALSEIANLNSSLDSFKQLVESYLDVTLDYKLCEDKIKDYQNIMKVNEQWEGQVTVKVPRRSNIPVLKQAYMHAHICHTCVQTCKYPCRDLFTHGCPQHGRKCDNCPCPNETHTKTHLLLHHDLVHKTVVHEDKKALYDEAKSKEESEQKVLMRLNVVIDEGKNDIDENVQKIIAHSNKIKEHSLNHKQLSPQELIDETLELIKLDQLSQTTEAHRQAYISPVLKNLNEQICAVIGYPS